MLKRASVAIARQSQAFTAVAKTTASLEALACEIGNAPKGRHSFVALDWNRTDEFLNALGKLDPPSLILAWLHDNELGPRIANAISSRGRYCEFFQILGSVAGSPMGGAADLRKQIETGSDLVYCQIILGFRQEAVSSRWLTDEEISEGTLVAISRKQSLYVIGSVTPWEARPKP